MTIMSPLIFLLGFQMSYTEYFMKLLPKSASVSIGISHSFGEEKCPVSMLLESTLSIFWS